MCVCMLFIAAMETKRLSILLRQKKRRKQTLQYLLMRGKQLNCYCNLKKNAENAGSTYDDDDDDL